MRTRIITIATAALFALTFTSCHKDDTYGGGGGVNPGVMTASINNALWYASSGYAQSPNAYVLNLYASYNNASYISISLAGGYTGPGNYVLGGVGAPNTAIFYDGNGTTYQSTSGTVNVTADNGSQVMGVFNFSGPASAGSGGGFVTVNNGQFNLIK